MTRGSNLCPSPTGETSGFGYNQKVATIDELWRQVAEAPDDLAPRLVLADALVEAGDVRGELIHLQCQRADYDASTLVRANWDRWLGDLGVVLSQDGTSFKDGMLHTIRYAAHGMLSPDRFQRAIAHRELCVVRCVRARDRINPAFGFDELLAALPDTLESAEVLTVESLARRAARSLRVLHVRKIVDASHLVATCPQLEELFVPMPDDIEADRFATTIEQLSAQLPRLRAIVIATTGWSLHDPQAMVRLRSVPTVRIART
jgi:uncharacterized protein (TIGR02996 family)